MRSGRFFHDLSARSRWQRFLTAAEPAQDLIDRLCDSSNPSRGLTLVALRHQPERTRGHCRLLLRARCWIALAELHQVVARDIRPYCQD
jgi:hypothetical protein